MKDLSKLGSYRVMLAPLRFGAGIKVKYLNQKINKYKEKIMSHFSLFKNYKA